MVTGLHCRSPRLHYRNPRPKSSEIFADGSQNVQTPAPGDSPANGLWQFMACGWPTRWADFLSLQQARLGGVSSASRPKASRREAELRSLGQAEACPTIT